MNEFDHSSRAQPVASMSMSPAVRSLVLLFVTLIVIGLSVYKLEQARSGIVHSTLAIGNTPATYFQLARQANAESAPLVIVAHGFAGSRQLMNSFSLNLARAGYEVIAFDFEGHGRNPVPMSGDVTSIDGTTRLLVAETRRVVAAARELRDEPIRIALLGHSMATDILLRVAIAESTAGRPVDTVVGISMFSETVTERVPPSLLMINGQWEGRLRAPSLEQLRLVEPLASEGDTARLNDVIRRAVVAPHVEHVSVLYSDVAVKETIQWMDMTFSRSTNTEPLRLGGWILLLLVGIVLAFKPLVRCLPASSQPPIELSTGTFLLAVLVPAVATPLLALLPAVDFLPVLVADYLMLHLAVFAIVQLLVMRKAVTLSGASVWLGAGALALWGIAVFGLALDRYAASFLPTAGRLTIVAVLCFGTIVFMIADSVVTGAGHSALWRRLFARLAFVASLGAAAAIDPERLMFLLLILPVLLLFYLVHGVMGRWIAQRNGPVAAGIGLGLCLAWALGVSFPLFDVQG